jgi:hypothetical protein
VIGEALVKDSLVRPRAAVAAFEHSEAVLGILDQPIKIGAPPGRVLATQERAVLEFAKDAAPPIKIVFSEAGGDFLPAFRGDLSTMRKLRAVLVIRSGERSGGVRLGSRRSVPIAKVRGLSGREDR